MKQTSRKKGTYRACTVDGCTDGGRQLGDILGMAGALLLHIT